MAKRKVQRKKNKQLSPSMFVGIFLAIVIIGISILVITARKDYTGFATCLVDEGYVMAGTEWCPHCQNQKKLFKGAFEDVLIPAGAYKNCDVDTDWCQENGVTGYPTWLTSEGNRLPGVQSLSTLAQVSGCPLK